MARMLTFFFQFDFVLHFVKGRSNVVADALSRPTVSGEHSNDSEVPTDHVPDTSHVVHESADECNEHFTLLDTHMVHAAFIQYIPLDVSQLDDVQVRGESRPIGVAQEQIHNAEFHVVSAHINDEVRKRFSRATA